MKLIYKITLRIAILMVITMSVWAGVFYYCITNEIYDEQDDSLEDYSEALIRAYLASDTLKINANGTNNDFFFSKITEQEALNTPHMLFENKDMYITIKDEYEPARVLTCIFKDAHNEYYKLTIYSPSIDSDDMVETISMWIGILFTILLISILSVNILVYNNSMKPLHRLLEWINSLKVKKKVTKLHNPTDIKEFEQLNQAVLDFAKRSRMDYEKQKEFISNASHEIQTPLAVCLNRLEMLSNTDLTEEQLGEIMKTMSTIQHISRLNKTLLFLSKIDNHQFQEQSEINLNELIKKQLEDFKLAYAHLHIDVKLTEEATFTARTNETLATTMVANLIKNAYVHNINGGSIDIDITEKKISIANTAEPDVPLNADKIFRRFYQGNKKKGSTGLGLAVVKAITEQSLLNVKYRYENQKHCFEILK